MLQNKIENGVHYSSQLMSRPVYDQTYGYFEARCIPAKSEAVNSAFWLMPRNTSNFKGDVTNGAEIDIFETPTWLKNGVEGVTDVVGTKMGGLTQNVHWGGYGDTYQSVGGHVYYPQPGIPAGYFDEMHVYGCKWTPDQLSFYVDGKQIFATDCLGQGAPRVAEYVLLSSAYSNWGGDPANAEANTKFVIDYVRVFQHPNIDK